MLSMVGVLGGWWWDGMVVVKVEKGKSGGKKLERESEERGCRSVSVLFLKEGLLSGDGESNSEG